MIWSDERAPDTVKIDEAIVKCTVLYLPVDLTHVPPHEPRPLQDAVSRIVIASDGVHGGNDRLGTPALPLHYPSRNV